MVPYHLLGVAAVCVAVGLGLWQLESWQAQRDLAAAQVAERDPVPLADVLAPGERFPAPDAGAPVEVSGTWQGDLTFLVADRVVDGTEGYWVVTPLAPDGGGGSLLPLVRGWTADPDALPAEPTGTATLTAWLQPGEGTGAADEDATDRVLPQVRLADVVRLLDTDIYDGYAVVDHERAENGGTTDLTPVTPDEVPSVGIGTGLRNFLYAVEWWVFAAFAAFVWWRFVKDEVEKARAADAPGPPDPEGPDRPEGPEDPETPSGSPQESPVASGA